MEVERRGDVGDVADGVDVDATVVLDVIGVLRLHEDTYVVIVFLLPVAEHKADVVGVVLVLGESAQALIEMVGHELVREAAEPGVPLAVDGMDALEGILREMTEIVGLTVALVLIVTQLVAGLQVGTFPEGLAILGIDDVTAVIARREIVTSGEVGGVLVCHIFHAIEVYLIVRGVVVLAIAHAAFES